MERVLERCAGLDVHKKTVTVHRAVQALERQGYRVILEPAA